MYSVSYCQNDLDKCVNLLKRSENIIVKQDSLIKILKNDVKLSELESIALRKQFENSEITMRYLNIELKKEIRNKKIWQVIGISSLTACLTTTILYLTKP